MDGLAGTFFDGSESDEPQSLPYGPHACMICTHTTSDRLGTWQSQGAAALEPRRKPLPQAPNLHPTSQCS
jgi:hypothetical protein